MNATSATSFGVTQCARRPSAPVGGLLNGASSCRIASSFDLVFTTWGTICWLRDKRGWTKIVAHFLKPGGVLYLADGHPAALVLDDSVPFPDGRPDFIARYLEREPVVCQATTDFVNETAKPVTTTEYTWMHPLGETVTGSVRIGVERHRGQAVRTR